MGLLALLIILAGNLLIVPLSAVLVLVWAYLSDTPWRTIGYGPPRSWARVFAIGIPSGIAFKLIMKALVMPLLNAPAVNPRYHYLAGNTGALPWAGLVFGAIYATTGQLWVPMVAHTAFDLTALALIYWNWESAAAHLLFR